MELRVLVRESFENIYETHMKGDFAANELKPGKTRLLLQYGQLASPVIIRCIVDLNSPWHSGQLHKKLSADAGFTSLAVLLFREDHKSTTSRCLVENGLTPGKAFHSVQYGHFISPDVIDSIVASYSL